MIETKTSNLGDIGKVCMCKRILKKQTTPSGDIPFYKISTFGKEADCYIPRDIFEDYKKRFSYPKKGDILISAAGTIGKTVIYNGEEAFFQDSNIVWIDNDETKVINDYLYYYYMTNPWVQTFGSTIARLYNDDIRNLSITYPVDIEEQRNIVKILRLLDCKISNNNAICSDLESMAKLLYDYWFVQLDFPDEKGRPYKSSGGKMVWNEELKREIPVGWEVKQLGKVLSLLKDGTHNPPKRVNNGIPLLTGTMFGNTFLNYSQATFITEKDYSVIHSQYAPQEADIIITKIGTLGNVNYIRKKDVPIAIHCNSALLRFPDKMIGMFPLMYCKSEEFQKRLRAEKGQSVQEFCSLDDISSVLMLLPDEMVVENYNKKMNSLLFNMEKLSVENKQLEEMRDFLLPMLMNGQVKVGKEDAEA